MICCGTKRNGQPCAFKCQKGTNFCGHHQPVDLLTTKFIPVDMSTHGLPPTVYKSAIELLGQFSYNLNISPMSGRILGLCDVNRKMITLTPTLSGVDFLDTFIHEFAHATTWEMYRQRGHCSRWKQEYHRHMKQFLSLHSWTSNEIEKLSNPGSVKHVTLCDMKEKYPDVTFVCELSRGQKFRYKGKLFMVSKMGRGVNLYAVDMSDSAAGNWKFSKYTRIDLEV